MTEKEELKYWVQQLLPVAGTSPINTWLYL